MTENVRFCTVYRYLQKLLGSKLDYHALLLDVIAGQPQNPTSHVPFLVASWVTSKMFTKNEVSLLHKKSVREICLI